MESLRAEARYSTTPVGRLRELAQREPALARIVAGRIGLPTDLAEELAEAAVGARDTATLRVLAAHPVTSPKWLAELAGHSDEGVRRAVALHRATPKSALRGLAGDASPAVRRALAAREKLPRSIAEVLLTDAVDDVRLTMARRFGARPKHLRALVGDPDPRVRRVLSRLGYADETAFTDDDPGVRRAAVARSGIDELTPRIDHVVRDPDPGVRELACGMGRNHSPTSLAVLAADSDPKVRRAAAANWFTPKAALTALAGDIDIGVVEAVSGNPSTPPGALEMIADGFPRDFRYSPLWDHDDPELHGRFLLCDNLLDHPRIPPEALRTLHAKNPPYFHEGNAMSQPNWPPDLLIEFALSYCRSTLDGQKEHKSYRDIDQARREAPLPEVLAMMLRSPIYYVRGGAAANRHTPPEALAEYVRTADPELTHFDEMAKNPATPVEILEAWASVGERHYDMLKNADLPESVLRIIAAGENDSYAEKAHTVLAVRASHATEEA